MSKLLNDEQEADDEFWNQEALQEVSRSANVICTLHFSQKLQRSARVKCMIHALHNLCHLYVVVID